MTDPQLISLEIERLKKALHVSENRFAIISSITSEAIIMIDDTRKIFFFNSGAEEMFGYPATEIIGQPLDRLIPSRFSKDHQGHISRFNESSAASRFMKTRGMAIFGLRKNGEEFPLEVSISKWNQNSKTIYTAICRDITDWKQKEEQIYQLANFDPLTGLPNRHLFHDLAEKAIIQGQADGKSVGVLLMDLDRFKEINDTLGHHRGDILLQKVAERLKKAVFEKDTIARMGGDEFGIVLLLADPDHAVIVAQKLLTALFEPFEIEGLPIVVEGSIGLAFSPDHGANADSLTQRADIAMYTSKKKKLDYVVYHPDLDEHSPRRLALMGELRSAIENRELFLNYQPIVDLKKGKISGVEALVRWNHPKLGPVPPDQFIPAAEQSGLIKLLTQFVLKESLSQITAWSGEGKLLTVSVNLSHRNLSDPFFPSYLNLTLGSSGISSGLINFEITESTIMTNVETVTNIIQDFNQQGFSFSIDDFGAGFTSLGHLTRLAVKCIKIDRTFIKDLHANPENQQVVRSMIDLAHNLQLKVVAEGVEEQKSLDWLSGRGCDEAQGYFIGKPMKLDILKRWLAESSWGLK